MSRKRRHHHGGAWKVAYADFITAMMALFMVLWITSQSQKIREAVERSFTNPFTSLTKDSTGVIPNKDTQAVQAKEGNFDSASMIELNMLRKLSQDLMRSLANNSEDPNNSPAKLDLLPEGLRISIFDRTKRPIFEEDSAEFTTYGVWVFSTLAWQVSRYTNMFQVELEGHTEKGHAPTRPNYGNWEISTDRANNARRLLLEHGVKDEQVRKIAGFADTQPMEDRPPTDETNRRVALLLRIQNTKNASPEPANDKRAAHSQASGNTSRSL